MDWISGLHLDWMNHVVSNNIDMPWDRVVTEGYIILNPESAVAKVTKAKTNLNNSEIGAFTNYGQLLGLDAIYIEYSGKYGDVNLVQQAKKYVRNSRFFYGGGISNTSQMKEMLKIADTIFVGNIIYNNIPAYLSTIPE